MVYFDQVDEEEDSDGEQDGGEVEQGVGHRGGSGGSHPRQPRCSGLKEWLVPGVQ